ncbi:MAG TPA: CdaR family protein [Candidatus Dormibacteraeota bacterium]|nr:CdaR family protein [Candidatus Dormibacteraeota bacterium]
MAWLVRNWHLKLGAVALATILYTGFVYSGSFTERPVSGVRVDIAGQPSDWIRLGQLRSVSITYRVATDSADLVQPESFTATVDFADYDLDQAAQPQSLRVEVRPTLDGVQILSIEPEEVTVTLDRVDTKTIPVRIDRGDVPEGLEIGVPELSVREVTARGAASLLARVDHARATVSIQPSGIDVNDQVELTPVDVNAEPVLSVELDPSSVTVQIDVEATETSKTVPVRPNLQGTVAAGFEIASVSTDPPVVTLRGLPAALAGVVDVVTEPLPIGGTTATLTLEGVLLLPPGTRLAEETGPLVVNVDVQPAIVTRTFLVGFVCQGAEPGIACLPQQPQAAVTLRGTAAALDALDAADLTPILDVAGLPPGEHDIIPALNLPAGVEQVSLSPGVVAVILRLPSSPSPAP